MQVQEQAKKGMLGSIPEPAGSLPEEVLSWREHWEHGVRYLEIAEKAFPDNPRFTPEMLYHLIGMALEGMFMAWLGQRGNLPDNHTVRDLLRAAEKIEALPEALRRELFRFDRFMGLCSLEPVPIPPPQAADLPPMLELARRTQAWIAERYRP